VKYESDHSPQSRAEMKNALEMSHYSNLNHYDMLLKQRGNFSFPIKLLHMFLHITCYSMTFYYRSKTHVLKHQTVNFFFRIWLYSSLYLGRFFSFLILYTVGRTPWTWISPSQGRYLHTEQHKHRINAHKHP
jgi:hypothetical protein